MIKWGPHIKSSLGAPDHLNPPPTTLIRHWPPTFFLLLVYELWGVCFVCRKPIFNTVTPVAAATVAPILATNTASSATTTGYFFPKGYSQRQNVSMQFITLCKLCTPKQALHHIPKWPVALLSPWQWPLTPPMLQLWPPLPSLSVSTTHSRLLLLFV